MTYYIRPCVSSIHVPLSRAGAFITIIQWHIPTVVTALESRGSDPSQCVYIFLFIVIIVIGLVKRRRLHDICSTPEELVASLSLHFNCSSGWYWMSCSAYASSGSAVLNVLFNAEYKWLWELWEHMSNDVMPIENFGTFWHTLLVFYVMLVIENEFSHWNYKYFPKQRLKKDLSNNKNNHAKSHSLELNCLVQLYVVKGIIQ